MKLVNEDCLLAMKTIQNETVDMVYLDPPFFSQTKQKLKDTSGHEYCFSDQWNSRNEYLEFMKERLVEIRRVINCTGSVFLHCDSTASHYLRVLLDDVFGEKNFRSEIIWSYKRWSNSKKGLIPAHQTIFWYSKTDKYKFHTLYNEYSATTNLDQILQERERNKVGKVVYRRDSAGNILLAKEKQGVPLSDVWDIPFLNPKAKERVGYPTQKPLELLERIIEISTDANDLVVDPFCGSGTTLVAAERLGRRAIGIDENLAAIELCNRRWKNFVKSESKILRLGEQAYKTKTDKELAILKQFDCNVVQRNRGIDAILKKYYLGAPVAIKIQRKNETVLQAAGLLKNASEKRKCKFYILIVNEPVKEHERYQLPENMIVVESYESSFERQIALQLSEMKTEYTKKKA